MPIELMKVNLLLDNPNGAIKGYCNIDPLCNGSDGRNKGDITNLDWAFDGGELEHIIINDILSYFPFPELNKILTNWIQKLAINGVITIRGVDFEEVCRGLTLGILNIKDASIMIYGHQQKGWDVRKSSLSILEVIKYLETMVAGLKITKKILDNYSYVVEAQRI